ncbi:hypothetical protein CIK75_01390 [Glutamicibacter sp. BW78]|uniref:hypothetical protein n=1 Tax=Glutamicibacter sp. BW78 TaxID=2024403 RepID=UPI000BB9B3C2|nr:hypothetical protein [Glutamicibacter sp. BW78]PCC26779.1 hypothetical protein CIK75_01390 [Glutamicibacter sp. BW78]
MNLLLATVLWVAGSTQFALAFQQLARANPTEQIPLFGRPKHHPGEIYVYRAIAFLLLIVAVLAWEEAVGLWAILLIFLGVIPTIVLNTRHNHRIQAKTDPSSQ